jgi:hypothetical protein
MGAVTMLPLALDVNLVVAALIALATAGVIALVSRDGVRS